MTDAVVFQRRSSAGPACAGVEGSATTLTILLRSRPRVRGGRGISDDYPAGEGLPAPRARG